MPATAADGDSANRFVIYRFTTSSVQPGDINDPSKIIDISWDRNSIPAVPAVSGTYYFVITSLDRNYNESGISSVVSVSPPAVPEKKLPANGAQNLSDEYTFVWNYTSHSSQYLIQVADDQTFSNIVFEADGVADTFKVVTGLAGQKSYYWRVKAFNAAGTGEFSSVWNFTTGFPLPPSPVYPPNNTGGIPYIPVFKWSGAGLTDSYSLQVARSRDFTLASMIIDTTGVTDTAIVSPQLDLNKFHFWRVAGTNQFGFSGWSEIFQFKTALTSVDDDDAIPTEYALYQNYPNPFNPATKIKYSIPSNDKVQTSNVNLKVYDVLGNEVALLVNETKAPGNYEVEFIASGLSSGVYFYKLNAGNFSTVKKLILLK